MIDNIKISPSLICMNLLEVKEQILTLNELADSYHFDIADYHFTRTFGFPLEFLVELKKIATLPIDIHLMVDDVESIVAKLVEINVGVITIPIECMTSNAFRIIRTIQNARIRVGVAINPITPLNNLDYILEKVDKITVMTFDPGVAGQPLVDITRNKILKLAELKKKNGYLFELEADGSCNETNFAEIKCAGISQCVVGTSGLFSLDSDIRIAWKKMKNYMTSYESFYRK